MGRVNLAEQAFKNGVNHGARVALEAQKKVQLVLCVLMAIAIVLSAITAVSLSRFAEETRTEMSELTAEVETITREFRDLAYRVDQLEAAK